jgi:hypothetical protein
MSFPDHLVYPCFEDLVADFPPGTYTIEVVYEDPNEQPTELMGVLPSYDPNSFVDPAPASIGGVDPNTVILEWTAVPGTDEYEFVGSCDPGLCEYEGAVYGPAPGTYSWEVPWQFSAGGACLIEFRNEDSRANFPPFEFHSRRFFEMDDRDGDGIPYYAGPPRCATGQEIDCVDNFPYVGNLQTDTDQNGIGDACQCGDVNADGVTNVTDALLIARGRVGSGDPNFGKCDANGDTFCNVTDALIIARGQQGSAHEDQLCPAYHEE